jgi:hypothetical protein
MNPDSFYLPINFAKYFPIISNCEMMDPEKLEIFESILKFLE